MIQRVQTLYLIGVVVAGILFLMLPIASLSLTPATENEEAKATDAATALDAAQATELPETEAETEAKEDFTESYSTEEITSTKPIATAMAQATFKCGNSYLTLLLESLTCIVAIITLFSYRKHKLQLRLSGFIIVLEIGMPILVCVVLKDYTFLHIRFGFGLPFIQIILTYLAMRGIFKDFLTLKSLDRLR